eukprot:441447-Rhodomonas_salina.1
MGSMAKAVIFSLVCKPALRWTQYKPVHGLSTSDNTLKPCGPLEHAATTAADPVTRKGGETTSLDLTGSDRAPPLFRLEGGTFGMSEDLRTSAFPEQGALSICFEHVHMTSQQLESRTSRRTAAAEESIHGCSALPTRKQTSLSMVLGRLTEPGFRCALSSRPSKMASSDPNSSGAPMVQAEPVPYTPPTEITGNISGNMNTHSSSGGAADFSSQPGLAETTLDEP